MLFLWASRLLSICWASTVHSSLIKRQAPSPTSLPSTANTVDTVAISSYASSLLAASSVQAYSKPTQEVTQVLAIGDSFTAGVGSNGKDDRILQSGNCRRYEQAYPLQLIEDDFWNDLNKNQLPVLNFGACSGAKMADLLRLQLTPGETWRDVDYHNFGKPQLALLTISGNDADFSTIVNDCIYRIARVGDCDKSMDALDAKFKDIKFSKELTNTLVQIVLRGREEKGADPPESFQLYLSGYVPFWNEDDHGCDTVTWSWWFFDKAYITTDKRKKMNSLVNDLNAVIKAVAENLSNLGVIYVEGFQDSYDGHRFCEPDTQDYLTKPPGSRTWFWHDDAGMSNGEGPDLLIPSLGFSNLTQQVLDLIIPDKGQQASISASNPPYNISPAFNDSDSLIAALNKAQGITVSDDGTLLVQGNNNNVSEILSEQLTRSFHPKGTAYGKHSAAFISAIKANRGPAEDDAAQPSPCQGNQVTGSCIAGSLPSAPPNSGVQGPACDKATGGGSPSPRLNSDKASQAAATWCAAQISAGLVLNAQSQPIAPDLTAGAAENGETMVISLAFDVSACPADGSKTSIDFKALGQEACVANLWTAISEVCEEDSTWQGYNPGFTIQGGVFGSDCGIWALYGQAA